MPGTSGVNMGSGGGVNREVPPEFSLCIGLRLEF